MSRLNRRRKVHKVLIVLVIHRYNKVKIQKVQAPYLTRTVGKPVSPVQSSRTHTPVRMLAGVSAIRSSRIYHEMLLHTVFLDDMSEYAFRRRRTAYVSQTHE